MIIRIPMKSICSTPPSVSFFTIDSCLFLAVTLRTSQKESQNSQTPRQSQWQWIPTSLTSTMIDLFRNLNTRRVGVKTARMNGEHPRTTFQLSRRLYFKLQVYKRNDGRQFSLSHKDYDSRCPPICFPATSVYPHPPPSTTKEQE